MCGTAANYFLQKSLAKPIFMFTFATDISEARIESVVRRDAGEDQEIYEDKVIGK